MAESKTAFSFSKAVREEVAAIERGKEASLALLSSYFRLRGKEENGALVFFTEQAQIARSIYERTREAFNERSRFAYTKGKGYLSRTFYKVIVEDPRGTKKAELRLTNGDVDPFFHQDDLVEMAYLAGAFMASGSVSSPSSSNYHLEIACPENETQPLLRFISKTGPKFPFKATKKGKKSIVYLKKSAFISDFLIYIGATQNCLQFENALVDRDFASMANRFSNIDGANYRRSQEAGEAQIRAIERASRNPGYLRENPKLSTLVDLRLTHPDASLNELARMMSETLGCTISKSNVNHLFRKIMADYGDKK